MVIKGETWDLTPLVPSTDVDKLQALMKKHVTAAEEFSAQYKGKIKEMDSEAFLDVLEEYQALALRREGVFMYARLSYAANSLDPTIKQIADTGRRMSMKIRQALAFVEIEVTQLVASKPDLVNDPKLSEYKHYLEIAQRKAPFMLTDLEERLFIQKDRFGIDSWMQLQNDWLATRTYGIVLEGKTKTMTFGEIIGLYEHPNREVRRAAKDIVWTGLGQDEIVWASALRAIAGDHLETSKYRKWPSPRTQSLIDNDVDPETIDALMNSVDKHTKLYRRYLGLKAKIMGLPKLGEWDVVAPLPNMPDRKFKWKEAQRITIDTYKEFDSELAQIVQHMFDKKRIDGEVRKGKGSGAWFSDWLNENSGFILLSYNGRLGEVFTLVHENGHAVHSVLMSKVQKPINNEIGMCIAEVGSIFGELLLADKLIAEANTKEEKQEVLVKILDEFGMSVFQVSARYFFEMDMYDAIERGEYLDGDTISKYWVKGRDRMYGDAVEWLPNSKWEWTFKAHYYLPRFRFYNYPYVFANLFVFALYRLYKEQGKDFAPKLKRLLSAGSTYSPRELASELGFDIATTEFWALGMKQAEEFINELEMLS